jgi:flavin reductase (DIM6/NTAB) family NADH-FMN oxidoreductase RutF
MKSFDPSGMHIKDLHGLLLGAVGPRPIALASTINEEGVSNLSPFSFFNVFSANPPMLIFSPARRGADNTTKHTYENVKKVPEVVVNIVNYDITYQMVLSSANYPEGVNEIEKAGFTALDSDLIGPKRIAESPVQFECIVKQVIELSDGPASGNLVLAEVVKIHVQEHLLNENNKIDQYKIDLVGRMGGDVYVRASGDALFEVSRPNDDNIGVDQLPKDIRLSKVLSGNDLAKLANVSSNAIPDETTVNEYKLIELSSLFMKYEDQANELELALHKHAKELIENGDILDAWKTLLTFND